MMAADLLWLVFAALTFWWAGRLLLAFWNQSRSLDLDLADLQAIGFMIGFGAVTLQMLLYSFVPVPLTRFSVLAPWLFVSVVAIMIPRFRSELFLKKNSVIAAGRPNWAERCLFLIIGTQLLYVFIYALLIPIRGWDAWSQWFLKARIFFEAHSVPQAFLLDPGSPNRGYPLMVPLGVAWVYICLGHAQDTLAKALYPLQYLALLILFGSLVRRVTSRKNALFFTALLASTPVVVLHAAGLSPLTSLSGLYASDFVGYADLTLAILMLGAGGFMALAVRTGKDPFYYGSAVFLGLSAWAKNEGLPFCLIGNITICFLWSRQKGLSIRKFLWLLVVFAVTAGPWLVERAVLRLSSEYVIALSPDVLFHHAGKFPAVFFELIKYLFSKIGLFNFTWHLFALSFFLRLKRSGGAFLWPLYILFFGQLGAYVLAYAMTPYELDWHIATALDRLLLHLTPLAWLITAAHVGERNKDPSGPA